MERSLKHEDEGRLEEECSKAIEEIPTVTYSLYDSGFSSITLNWI